MKKIPHFIASLALGATAVLALAPTSATAGLIGVTYFGSELFSINVVTGEGLVATVLSEPVQSYGLATRGSKLYTFDPGSDRIRAINRLTGALSDGVDIGVGDLTGEGDLAFRQDGVGFLSSALAPDFTPSNDLFRFDLTLGTSVRVGTTDVVLDGMVFVGNTLYAIGQEADARLYIVNQDTAALTSVGSLGLTVGSPVSALTADSQGSLYAALDDRLYAIDRDTGLAMAVDQDVQGLGYGGVSGLAFTPVPEPSTYGLAGVAALAVVAYVRRKRMRGAA